MTGVLTRHHFLFLSWTVEQSRPGLYGISIMLEVQALSILLLRYPQHHISIPWSKIVTQLLPCVHITASREEEREPEGTPFPLKSWSFMQSFCPPPTGWDTVTWPCLAAGEPRICKSITGGHHPAETWVSITKGMKAVLYSSQGRQTFSEREQRANIFSFVDYPVSVLSSAITAWGQPQAICK